MTATPERAPHAIYQAHLDQGRLAYQYSPAAARAVFPPRVLCPHTGSDRLEWRVSRGLGTVYSLTHIAPHQGEPYCIALVDLDEGFRLMTRLLPRAGHEPAIGDRVRARTLPLGGDAQACPVFEAEDAHHGA